MAQIQAPASPSIVLPGSAVMPRKRWTREEWRRLQSQGFLEAGRYELIEGEILVKARRSEPRAFAILQILRVLTDVFAFDTVRPPVPVAINEHNEPEPDVAVVTRALRDSPTAGTLAPRDIRLLVDVSSPALRADRAIKAAVYGRAGIPEYWIVNTIAQTLEVFRHPGPGGYANVTRLTEKDTIRPLSALHAEVRVMDLRP